MAKAKSKEPEILEIEGVPTVAGLAKLGRQLAYIRPDGKYHVTDEGHARMQAALKANAQERILNGEGDWEQPPSSGKERTHD